MSEPALKGEELLDVQEEAAPPPPVSLRGAGAQLVLALDAEASFEALRDGLRALMSEPPGRFKGSTLRLDLGTRAIALFDLRRLVHLLKDEFEVVVTGLYCSTEALKRYAEQELKLKVFLADPEEEEPPVPASPAAAEEEEEEDDLDAERPTVLFAPEPEEPVAPPEPPGVRRMLALDKTVRSGATVRFAGDVVVYGDVNAGGQVMATGNILVLGALRGMAHAGCDGDERAVVIGFDLRPTQIRIARMIAIAPDRGEERGKRGGAPEIAWVIGDRIVIEEYRGRLPG